MHPHLVALAAGQGGVFTRTQALAVGCSPADVRRATRPGGPWLVVRRGVYAARATWDQLDHHGRRVACDWAGHLTMQHEHVMSHDSAGRAYDLSLLRPRQELVHVTRPGVGGTRTEHGVKHHLSQGLPWRSYEAAGLPVTPLARTAVDIAREQGLWGGVCAVDSARRAGATERDFARALVAMRHFPHIRRSRTALALGDPGAENAGESMARLLVLELGLPGEVITQYPVAIGGRVVWIDLVVGCHAFEFDGKLKFLRPALGGVADRAAGEIVWDEKERQRLVCAEGLGMSRIIWDDFWGTARDRARTRLRQEGMLSVERLGVVRPPHLDEFFERTAPLRAERLTRLPRRSGHSRGGWPPRW